MSQAEKIKRREIQEKLNKQYIDQKINPVVEPMTLAFFASDGSKDPVNFMIDFIKENYGNRPSVNEGEHIELEYLRSEVKALQKSLGGNKGDSTASDNRGGDSSSDSEGDEDFVDDLPMTSMAPKPATGPRQSVSAEVFGRFNKEVAYVPPVHKKTPEQIEAIKKRMANNFMFSALNPKDKKSILDAIVPVKKTAGEVVIQQGDDGDNFYLLESGNLNCTKFLKPEDKEETFLKVYEPGESFGELALLYNAPRAATIKVKSAECLLWSLERGAFNSIVKTAVQKKREKYEDFLEKVEILSCMESKERLKVCDAFKEEWYENGEYIIKQGDAMGNKFYMIVEGNCIATKVLEPGKPAQTVKDYKPGDYFGERSLLMDAPRAANVIAQSQVCVVSLERQSFKRLMGPLEEILARNENEYNKFC